MLKFQDYRPVIVCVASSKAQQLAPKLYLRLALLACLSLAALGTIRMLPDICRLRRMLKFNPKP